MAVNQVMERLLLVKLMIVWVMVEMEESMFVFEGQLRVDLSTSMDTSPSH